MKASVYGTVADWTGAYRPHADSRATAHTLLRMVDLPAMFGPAWQTQASHTQQLQDCQNLAGGWKHWQTIPQQFASTASAHTRSILAQQDRKSLFKFVNAELHLSSFPGELHAQRMQQPGRTTESAAAQAVNANAN